ncbi:2TM domain-containing protein [uncultured Kriegella sp.]|uniref:2TM domain-containing protein n=1 Tax=uncultured Kriegella sp. TaxID=1798910 RepID=UPI0030D87E54|tara:strand:+ start:25954 stop:27291 length:1338 start_codon:yes stop_codon:yes gene_type:complete
MRRFGKDLGNALLVGTLIGMVILVILYFMGEFDGGVNFQILWREYYENMIFSIIIYFSNIYTWRYFNVLFGDDMSSLKRLLIGVLGNFGASIVAIFVSRMVVGVGIRQIPPIEFLKNESPGDYYISLIIAMVVVGVFYAFYYYKYWQETKVKEQKIIAGTASAKFDALKNQLDPHFLFNSLNVLTSLIDEDPAQAQRFTTSLSKVYRYVLEQKNKDLITVDEELEFARTYIKLLKMRFEESIVFDIPERSSDPDVKIVPLSLQLLLENAVKHNVVTADRPLRIVVCEEEGVLVISNNLQEKLVVKKGSGVGLRNIQERYGILTDRKIIINKTASEFSVRLPMLIKQISVMETQRAFIDDKRYQKAKERVESIKGFYYNLMTYCLVIPFLAYLNYRTTSFPWVVFPIVGWGFGIIMHGLEAFQYNPLWGKSWEERKIKEYMDKDEF